jgi:phosphoribosylformimino-5-aminoimidazole carboxamide ribotide isomerase
MDPSGPLAKGSPDMDVIPAIDVLDGSAVRLRQGAYDDVTAYAHDPIAVARAWVAEGASLIHVVDLDAARGRGRDHALLSGLAEAGVPFQIGGGVRTVADARDVIAHGAMRAVIGSVFVSSPRIAWDITTEIGSERVVAALDVRAGMARGSGWRDLGRPLADVVESVVEFGIPSALVTGIERDGTLDGPDLELLADVRRLAPTLGIIASGGVGSLDDVSALAGDATSPAAVIVGKALYERRFTLAEAIAAARTGDHGGQVDIRP